MVSPPLPPHNTLGIPVGPKPRGNYCAATAREVAPGVIIGGGRAPLHYHDIALSSGNPPSCIYVEDTVAIPKRTNEIAAAITDLAFAIATAGVGGALGAGGATAGATAAATSSGESAVQNTAVTLENILGPITTAFDDVSKLIRDVQDKLIAPIVTPITTAIQAYHKLSDQIESDLHHGLTGLLAIPGQIADALTGETAALNRSVQELGRANASIASDILVPGLRDAGAGPLGELTGVLKPSAPPEDTAAVFDRVDHIAETQPAADIEDTLKTVEQWVQDQDGIMAPLLHLIWQVLSVGELLGVRVKASAEQYLQYLNTQTPTDLIPVGRVIEAWRRGLLTPENAIEELKKQSLDLSRINLLYDLARYLFTPEQAVRLRYRGQITDAEYTRLTEQNGLDAGQAQALYGLHQFVFPLGDLAALVYRGALDEATYRQQAYWNGVTPEDADLALALAAQVVNPRSMVAASGRESARGLAPLEQSMSQSAPEGIRAAYRRAQLPEGQADLDWLLHWRVPPASWWIDAYFRGIRSLSDVYAALERENVPRELWDDFVTVDRELPPVWLVPDVIASGVWDKDQALGAFKQLGFSDENALVLYNYGASKGKTSKASTAQALQGLSLSTAADLYSDGALDRDEYLALLAAHGLGSEAAELTVELADLNAATQQRKDAATDLVAQVSLGVMDVDTLVSRLFASGYTDSEVAGYQKQALAAQRANIKMPSESQLASMFKKGIIDEPTYAQQLGVLGYPDVWAARIIALEGGTSVATPNA